MARRALVATALLGWTAAWASPSHQGSTPSAEPSGTGLHLPAPTRLVFTVQGKAKNIPYQATAELRWQHEGGTYHIEQRLSAFLLGMRTQTSHGTLTHQGLRPERFTDSRRNKTQTVRLDHPQAQAYFDGHDQPSPLPPGAQDRLSVFFQLSALLGLPGATPAQGRHFSLPTLNARRGELWVFAVEGQETLKLPIGPTPALKLQRQPRQPDDQSAELWLGTNQDWLPVRIRLGHGSRDEVDMRLSERHPL